MIQSFTSVDKFEKLWNGFLTRDNEVANNLPSRILSYCPRDEAEFIRKKMLLLCQNAEDGSVNGFAFMTPPHRLVLSAPYAGDFETLVDWFLEKGKDIPGVVAEKENGVKFAKCWTGKTNGTFRVSHEMTIYELRDRAFFPGHLPAGKPRVANNHDKEELTEWLRLFEIEANLTIKTEDPTAIINKLVDKGEIFVWETGDNGLAGCARRVPLGGGGSCVNFVYTPKSMRKQGIASQMVAKISQDFLDENPDSYCCLFTDNANPTSNSIYQKIGYREVAQFIELDFL